MGQQLYLLKRYHEPLSFIDSDHAITEGIPDDGVKPAKALATAASTNGAAKPSGNKPKKKNRK